MPVVIVLLVIIILILCPWLFFALLAVAGPIVALTVVAIALMIIWALFKALAKMGWTALFKGQSVFRIMGRLLRQRHIEREGP